MKKKIIRLLATTLATVVLATTANIQAFAATPLDRSKVSCIFNAGYYATTYPDVLEYATDYDALLNHYMTVGIYEGRDASPYFNLDVYMNNNPDLVAAFGDDKEKYIEHYLDSDEDRVSHDYMFSNGAQLSQYVGRAWANYDEVLADVSYFNRATKEMTDEDRRVIAARGGVISDDGYGGYIVSYYIPLKLYSYGEEYVHEVDHDKLSIAEWEWILVEDYDYGYKVTYDTDESGERIYGGVCEVRDLGWSNHRTLKGYQTEQEYVAHLDEYEANTHYFSDPDNYTWY